MWLEQRVSGGLWKKLFSFPKFIARDGVGCWMQQHMLKSNSIEELTDFQHTFSNYHVHIVLILFEMNAVSSRIHEKFSGIWYNLVNPPLLGLPAPVNRLLRRLAKQFLKTINFISINEKLSMNRYIFCKFLQRYAEGQDFQFYSGDIGKRIFDEISKEAWGEWMKKQTMLINKKKLNMINIDHYKLLETEMIKFLFKEKICT